MQPFLQSPQTVGARVRGAIQLVFLFSIVVVTVMMVNVFQMMSLVIYPVSRSAFRKFNCWLANLWWSMLVKMMEFYGVRVVIGGDKLPSKENVLVVGNHQEMTDIPALMPLARLHNNIGNMKWFAKEALKYIPGPGWGMQFIGCVFLARNWADDKASIERTFHTIKSNRLPVWLMMFIEGTRITPYKLQQSREYARRRNLPIPEHTMIPRTKGFVATIQGLGDYLDAVYDVTIAYPQGIPNLWQLMAGYVREIHLYVRRFPTRDMPRDPDQLKRWMVERFQEKDDLLTAFFAKGSFPVK